MHPHLSNRPGEAMALRTAPPGEGKVPEERPDAPVQVHRGQALMLHAEREAPTYAAASAHVAVPEKNASLLRLTRCGDGEHDGSR